MIIHIFEDTPHHYLPMSEFFLNECDINTTQEFWVRASKGEVEKKSSIDTEFLNYTNAKELIALMSQRNVEDVFVFHGLVDINIYLRLILNSLKSRCSCIFWGYELYRYNQPKISLKLRLVKWFHRSLLKKFQSVFTLTPGDGELVKDILKRQDVKVLPYPGIGITDILKFEKENEKNAPLKIMVGNSAAPSNEHLKIFSRLKHLNNENVEIIVPLNYAGNDEYIGKVTSVGREIFGDKFKSITEMLDKKDYDLVLSKIDVLVFSHKRQQGLYAIYAMLLMGKPVYLRKETSSYKNFTSLGFTINAYEDISINEFCEMSDFNKKLNSRNQELMNEYFTEKALAPRWSSMLNNLPINH